MNILRSGLVLVCALVASSYAIVCTPQLCEGVKKVELNCKGTLIPNGGFCGCTDICAGVEGDSCQLAGGSGVLLLGVPNTTPCDQGYECVAKSSGKSLLGSQYGECRSTARSTTMRPRTMCEQARMVRMISFVIWEGMWTPRCLQDGSYAPKQCDNTGACFCVTADEGQVIVGSKKQGDVTC